jgi:hypothetical protein
MNRKPYHLRISPPSAYEIALHWEGLEPRFVTDVRSPHCFACNFYPFGDGYPRGLEAAWRKRLQRCHIIARSAGGSYHPENFLILCTECHHEAPMTSDREIMLRWAREHISHVGKYFLEIKQAIDDAKMEHLLHLWRQDEDDEAADRFLREHHLDFHPHATRAQRIRAITLVYREFLELKQFEREPLFRELR